MVPAASSCSKCRKAITVVWVGMLASECHRCSHARIRWELKKSLLQLRMVESRLEFLRPKKLLHNERVDVNLEGDVMIVVQGRLREPLFAHKYVLCRRSSVFCEMFSTKMPDVEPRSICIYDASLGAMKALIRFCYYAEVNFTDEVTAEEVVEVAQKYDTSLLQTYVRRI